MAFTVSFPAPSKVVDEETFGSLKDDPRTRPYIMKAFLRGFEAGELVGWRDAREEIAAGDLSRSESPVEAVRRRRGVRLAVRVVTADSFSKISKTVSPKASSRVAKRFASPQSALLRIRKPAAKTLGASRLQKPLAEIAAMAKISKPVFPKASSRVAKRSASPQSRVPRFDMFPAKTLRMSRLQKPLAKIAATLRSPGNPAKTSGTPRSPRSSKISTEIFQSPASAKPRWSSRHTLGWKGCCG